MNRQEQEQEWTLLMHASLDGDEQAYRRLLMLLSDGLRATVQNRLERFGASRAEAEDIVQEILLAVHLKRNTWDSRTALAPWIAAITRNKLVDAYRRRGRHEEIEIESVMESLHAQSTTDDSITEDVGRALATLSTQQREIVRSIALEGCSAQETASRLSMSEVAVRVTLHRSMKTLAARFRSRK